MLSGAVNERIAGWLSKNGVRCRRMSGKTQGLLIAEPLLTRGGKSMGFVGKIAAVNPAAVQDALHARGVIVTESHCAPSILMAVGESPNRVGATAGWWDGSVSTPDMR